MKDVFLDCFNSKGTKPSSVLVNVVQQSAESTPVALVISCNIFKKHRYYRVLEIKCTCNVYQLTNI